ncbi:MAG TPA: hypothetical protein PLS31_04640, partial [Candidatus Sumerlaeota bacterium]|nr:hypothetical protein [Candidatus Sumerlaeota bacterium]
MVSPICYCMSHYFENANTPIWGVAGGARDFPFLFCLDSHAYIKMERRRVGRVFILVSRVRFWNACPAF